MPSRFKRVDEKSRDLFAGLPRVQIGEVGIRFDCGAE